MDAKQKSELLVWAEKALAECPADAEEAKMREGELADRLERCSRLAYQVATKRKPRWIVDWVSRIKGAEIAKRLELYGTIVFQQGGTRLTLCNSRASISAFLEALRRSSVRGEPKAVMPRKLPARHNVKVAGKPTDVDKIPTILRRAVPEGIGYEVLYNREAGEYALTDGRTLVVILAPAGGLYAVKGAKVAEPHDKGIAYPRVVPGYRAGCLPNTQDTPSYEVGTGWLCTALQMAKTVVDADRVPVVLLYDMGDGKMEVVGKDYCDGMAFESGMVCGGRVFAALDANRVLALATALAHSGAARITVASHGGPGDPVLFAGSTSYAVLMQLRDSSDYKSDRAPRKRALPV